MNLLRILKTGTWKIPCALLLAGVLALACLQCSVRSLVYLPPQPRDKTAYLENVPPGNRIGAPSTIMGPNSAAGLLKRRGSPSWYITGETPWTSP